MMRTGTTWTSGTGAVLTRQPAWGERLHCYKVMQCPSRSLIRRGRGGEPQTSRASRAAGVRAPAEAGAQETRPAGRARTGGSGCARPCSPDAEVGGVGFVPAARHRCRKRPPRAARSSRSGCGALRLAEKVSVGFRPAGRGAGWGRLVTGRVGVKAGTASSPRGVGAAGLSSLFGCVCLTLGAV